MLVSSGGAAVHVLRFFRKSSFAVGKNKTNKQNEAKPKDSKKALVVMFAFLDPDLPKAKLPIIKEVSIKTTMILHFNLDFLNLKISAIFTTGKM